MSVSTDLRVLCTCHPRICNWQDWDTSRNSRGSSHGLLPFRLPLVSQVSLQRYISPRVGAKSRSLQLGASLLQRVDRPRPFGAGTDQGNAVNVDLRLIGGAGCMCIAASVAELVSAYPVLPSKDLADVDFGRLILYCESTDLHMTVLTLVPRP